MRILDLKISCENSPSNITKSYSVNVTGVTTGQGQQQQEELQQEQKPTLEEEGETTGTKLPETSNDGNTPLRLPFSSDSSDKQEGPSESQKEEGEVTTNNQDNDYSVNLNEGDEPTIYWDLD
jgi:hypothetical protein